MKGEGKFADTVAGRTVMELASKRGYINQVQIRDAIKEKHGVEIHHQKFSQWIAGDTSFPNNFADLFSSAIGLNEKEMVELSIALSFGQRRTRLLRPSPS